MKALRFHGPRDLRIDDVPEPTLELGPRDVIVRTRWCGVCGTDLHEFTAGPLQIPARPQILGHEFAGDVAAVGSAVTNVRAGDRVSVMPLAYCGECHFCRRGLNNLCPSMMCTGLMTPWGGFASAAVVRDYQAWPLPDGVTYEQGALIEPAAAAAYAVQRSGVRPGDTVLITGGGPIGQLAMLASFAAGAVAVNVSEPNVHRRALALELGATQSFDPSDIAVEERLREQTGGLGVDAAIECAGFEPALRTCLAAVRPRGTVAQVGLHLRPGTIDAMLLAQREINLVGTWGYPVHEWPRVIKQVASRALPVERVVTDRVALASAVASGFEPLLDPAGRQIKVLVEPTVCP